jgi:Flp pilus assembly protein TadB
VIVIAAVLAAASGWLLVAPAPDPRLRRLLGEPRRQQQDSGLDGRWVWASAVVAAAAAWLLLGGVLGLASAVVALVIVPRLLVRLEPRAARERREQLGRQAPLLADLVAAVLTAGATVRDALEVAGAAIGSPTVEQVRPVVAAIDLGADPASAWQACGVLEAHAAIVDALTRAQDSGAPAAILLGRAADDLRRERRRMLEVAARSAGVRAVAPLAACFLPAFLLVGVVPVVASLASGLLGP